MTTDNTYLTTLAHGLKNVPSTFESLKDQELQADPHFKPFLDIFANEKSTFKPITPIGQSPTSTCSSPSPRSGRRARSPTSRPDSTSSTSRSPSSCSWGRGTTWPRSRSGRPPPPTGPRGRASPPAATLGQAAAAGRARLHVAVDHRVQRLLRVPDGRQPVLLLYQVRHPEPAGMGGPGQLPVHVHQRPAVLGGDQEHAVDHGHPGPAPGAVRHRHGDRPDQGQARAAVLPDGLLPAHHGPAGGGRARVHLHPQPGRAGQPHPGAAAPARAAVVRGPALDQAGPDPDRPVGHRPGDDHLPGLAAGRAQAAVRGGRPRGGQALAAVPPRDPADDLPGNLLLGAHRDDPGLPVLHPGLRDLQGRRPGPRGRVPPGLAAVLHQPPVPAGLRGLPHGLRGRPVLGDVRGHHGRTLLLIRSSRRWVHYQGGFR